MQIDSKSTTTVRVQFKSHWNQWRDYHLLQWALGHIVTYSWNLRGNRVVGNISHMLKGGNLSTYNFIIIAPEHQPHLPFRTPWIFFSLLIYSHKKLEKIKEKTCSTGQSFQTSINCIVCIKYIYTPCNVTHSKHPRTFQYCSSQPLLANRFKVQIENPS